MIKQLVILSDDEISKLYDLPKFDEDARLKYFVLDESEKAILNTFHRVFAKVYFILQLGYFKAKQLFYVFDLETVEIDARYICEHYYPQHILQFEGRVSKPTRLAQQKTILELQDYKVANEQIRATLLAKAEDFAKLHSKPVFIFRELLNYMELNRIVLPRYSRMRKDIIAQALINERKRLESVINQIFSSENFQQLNRLLEDKSIGGNYLLTWLQQEPSSFKYYQMRTQVLRKQEMEIIHQLSVTLIPYLAISNENIRYYASLSEHYSVYKLKRMKGNIVYVYLLCFAYTR